MTRVLLTGFTTFGAHTINPSQLIVEALADRCPDVVTAVLPVEYAAAGEHIIHLIEQRAPDAIVMLGLAAGRPAINLERFALNIDDARVPDNAGELRSGQPITLDGPAAYLSTLPLEVMHAALQARNIPTTISNHAGGYICNHIFYTASHYLAQADVTIPCGFIHVPPIDEQPDQPGLPLNTHIEAVACCLAVLIGDFAHRF